MLIPRQETKVNGKSMSDTMSALYKSKQSTTAAAATNSAKKPPPPTNLSSSSSSSSDKPTFAIDAKGDSKLLGCGVDFGLGLAKQLHTV